MRCFVSRPSWAKRIGQLAGAVALAGLSAACSADISRFGPTTTGSTGPATAAAPTEAVQRSDMPPVSGRGYAGQSTAPSAGGEVVVRPGQTVYAVSREHNVPVQDLIAANGLASPYHVQAGQRLRLPGGTGASYAANGSAVRADAAYAPAQQPSTLKAEAGGVHTVKAGETLYSLGRTYGVSPMTIASANGFSGSYQLKVGERVRIPGAGGSSLAATESAGTKVAALTPGTDTMNDASTGKSDRAQPVTSAGLTDTGGDSALPAPAARATSEFRWPVKGRVISRFGEKPNGSRNDGINIAVPEGTSVRAAENGVVAYAGNELKGYGNLVLVRHEDGWVTAYAHNKELLVKRGDVVKRGDIVAKAGQTGSVTSPQVHFEIRKGAQAVDPTGYLSASYLAGD